MKADTISVTQGSQLQEHSHHGNCETPLPLPPDEYMMLVCGNYPLPQIAEIFGIVGKLLVDMLDGQQMLSKDVRFLDIGCGCGRLPRNLLNRELASYTGFDRHPGMIDWCQKEITSRHPNFRFHHFDIKSVYEVIDQNAGSIDAATFQFPFNDGAFDSVLLASVFTHMTLREISNYLREVHRTLSPGGKVLLSVFFNEKEEEKTLEDYNVLVGQRMFLDAVKEADFECRFVRDTGAHQWYVLRRDAAGSLLSRSDEADRVTQFRLSF